MSDMNYKILLAGSVGSGKTTSIQAISDIPTFETEEVATDEVRLIKRTTTVAMDYGQMHLDDGSKIHLYGAPGQGRFEFMSEILSEGALGVLILVNNSEPDPLRELNNYLNAFGEFVRKNALVVGITRSDIGRGPSLNYYRNQLNRESIDVPVFTLDARSKTHVARLVTALMYRIDPWLGVAVQ